MGDVAKVWYVELDAEDAAMLEDLILWQKMNQADLGRDLLRRRHKVVSRSRNGQAVERNTTE